MKPTIGRVVIYNTGEEEREALRILGCNKSEQLPATIVAAWGDDLINVKVQVDGIHPDLWRTSISEGTGAGQWQWPMKEYLGDSNSKDTQVSPE